LDSSFSDNHFGIAFPFLRKAEIAQLKELTADYGGRASSGTK
jgi:hypothetical protein